MPAGHRGGPGPANGLHGELRAAVIPAQAALLGTGEGGTRVLRLLATSPSTWHAPLLTTSLPVRLACLPQDPYPEGTCFRSAYHVYTFAAGIGYNTNSSSVECESPVLMGFSNWMRGLYRESDEQSMQRAHHVSTSGIVMKNVVWLSRRYLLGCVVSTHTAAAPCRVHMQTCPPVCISCAAVCLCHGSAPVHACMRQAAGP